VAALVLPVGHDLGGYYDGSVAVHQVRRGVEVVTLSAGEYRTWSAAHGARSPAPDASLRERGLLAEVTPGAPESVEFASTHRLLPLALGLGNTADQPGLFAVGLWYQPLVLMTGALFDLWQWAHLAPDLWMACRESAAVAADTGARDPEVTDPARVLEGVLGSLGQLLAARVACLDVRAEGVS
jgi:hypothetical protein